MSATPARIVRAAEITEATFDFAHPLDDGAQCRIAGISRLAGMAASGVNLVTVAPGARAFPLHRHHAEEEWLYVLSGHGRLSLDDEAHDLDAGDFVLFPPAGPAHAVTNASPSEALVCLMGGNRVAADVIDFPVLGQRVMLTSGGFEAVAADAVTLLDPFAQTQAGHGGRT